MIPPRQIVAYNAFKRRLCELGFKQYSISKELRITNTTVSSFFACRFNKISKRNFRLIRHWLIEHNVIIVKPRPKHECPICGKVHVIAKPKVSV